MTTTRTVGRPKAQDDSESLVRQQLVAVALELFTERNYAAVSTREIAELAQSNIGMIRYYFGNKAGLFEACIVTFYQPMVATLQEMARDENTDIEKMILCYYKLLGQHPNWPKMLITCMQMDSGTPQRQVVERVMSTPRELLLSVLSREGALQPHCDARFAASSVMGMILFPFLMPNMMRQRLGLELDPTTLTELAAHHAQVLRHGLLAESNNDRS